MLRDVLQPATEQISLSAVYDALSDPVRRLIIAKLAEHGELNCSSFLDYGSKTALSYHLARLREAGITATRIDGKLRFMCLREADLEARFPGLLKAMIASAQSEARAADGEKPFRVQLPASAKPAAETPKTEPSPAMKKAPRRKSAASDPA